VRCHSVSRYDPASLAQMMCNSKLIIVMSVLRVETESHKRQTVATLLAHDKEAELFEISGEIISCPGKIHHDRSIAALSETDQLIILANDLRSALGEVECERGLVSTEIVDVENKLLREVFGRAPNDPAYSWVDLHDLIRSHLRLERLDLLDHTCAQRR